MFADQCPVIASVVIRCFRLRWIDTQCITHLAQSFGTHGVGEKPVVSNAVEPARQDVYQKAPEKLINTECECAIAITPFAPVIFPFERDVVSIARQQTTIGNGDAVCVTREVVQYRLGSVERSLGINHPVNLPRRAQ